MIGGGTVRAVAVLKATALHLGSGCGLKSGRQAAWRPGCNQNGVVTIGGGTVQQLPCLKVTAWFLGSGLRSLNSVVKLLGGRGTIGMVSSQLVAALCKQLPCLKVTAWFLGSGLRGLNSVVKLLGGRAIGMVSSQLVGGTVQAVAVFLK